MKLTDPSAIPLTSERPEDSDALGVIAKIVLGAIDGNRNISDIAELSGLDTEMVGRVIGDLVSRGLVVIPSAVPPPAFGIDLTGEDGEKNDGPEADPLRARAERPPHDKTELRRQIDELFESLGKINNYDLLGVDPDADRKELRAAYFELSKKFHPDRAFGEDKAACQKRMEVVFREITKAYETLSNANTRKGYDETIGSDIELFHIAKQLTSAVDISRASGGLSSAPPSEPEARHGRKKGLSSMNPFPTQPPAESQGPTADKDGASRYAGIVSRVTRQAKAVRSLDESASKPQPTADKPHKDPGHDPPDETEHKTREQRRVAWQKQRVARSLEAVLRRASTVPMPSPSGSELSRAKMALEQERFTDAVAILTRLVQNDKDDKDLSCLLDRAKVAQAAALGKAHLSQGLIEQRRGHLQDAQKMYQTALETDPASQEARHLLAQVLLEQRKDLSRALMLAKESVSSGNPRSRYYVTMGDLLLLGNETGRAREAYHRALQIEPDNKEIQKKLKACCK